jgi:hypothetical protein
LIFELIATVVLGLGAAGLALGLNVATGKRLPTWVIPASAGTAMLVFIVFMEYSWASRTTDSLPDGVKVASVSQESMWYRPWTYVRPLSLRMVAVDTRRNRQHPNHPDQVMTSVLLLGRWMPVHEIPVVFDCTGQRRADLHAGVQLGADGSLDNADWRRLHPADPALQVACKRAP